MKEKLKFSQIMENKFVLPEKVLSENSKYVGAIGLDDNFHITVWELENKEKVNVLMYTDYSDFGIFKCVRLSDKDMDRFNEDPNTRLIPANTNTNGITHTLA